MTRIKHERESFFELCQSDLVSIADASYVVEKLARGGMGFVLLLKKESESKLGALGLWLALKTVLPSEIDSEGIILFKRELTVWSPFRHPNVVSLLEILDGGDAGWVAAMDWCPGSLRDILVQREKLPIKEATDIMNEIINGLQYAYARDRILHLDLKPENILYNTDLNKIRKNATASKDIIHSVRFMLADWGIASIKQRKLNAVVNLHFGSGGQELTMNNMGTEKYMAPERFVKGYASSIYSDMFSLGLIYLEMLTGKLPYADGIRPIQGLLSGEYIENANSLLDKSKVPNSISDIIRTLISNNPLDRPSNYQDLKSHLVRAYKKSQNFFSNLLH